ncbi:MAG: hypothetical protein E6J15_01830 [Chloroflexi bacterium]|nr:MAG: hypothetical protein E6J15_01830 [Chloroflexota bacterium]
MVPLEILPLPRPLDRFGTAFPLALADLYANAYTPRRGVVLDPLAHPWSAADAAERADRRGTAKSREPLGEWARRVIALAPASDEIFAALDRVGESALVGTPHRVAMRELYGSTCATCRGPVIVEAFLWERDAPAPTKKAFRCGICAREGRALLIEATNEDDERSSQRLEQRGMAYWQFVERFGPDANAQALGESTSALYTPRNLTALMATLRAIETAIAASPARDVLLLCVLEVLISGSRLNTLAGRGAPLRIEKGRARRSHASQSREVNVWLEFDRTVRELAVWLVQHPSPARPRSATLALDTGDADLVLCQAPVEDGLGGWSAVAAVALLGLRGTKPVDAGEGRAVGRERLLRTMRAALIDGHRGSRPEAPAVVYVPQADLASIAAVALAGAGAGYRLRGITYQRDALATGAASSSGAAAVCDFDRDIPLLRDQGAADASSIEDAIRAGVRDLIRSRGEPVATDRAAVAALESLAARKLLAPLTLARAGGVSELEVFVDHFRSALADAARSGIVKIELDGAAAEHAHDTTVYSLAEPIDATPLDDRLEWGVWGLLSASRDVETRTLLRRAYGLFRDVETPDRELVERCIAAYGHHSDDGRWRLRDEDALVRRQADQTLLAVELIDAARHLGFKVHVGRDLERRVLPEAHVHRGAVLGDLMTREEQVADVSRVSGMRAEALEYIDVVWYDKGRMVFLWQLEWTARLHRSVVALGEGVPDEDRVFRFFAIADERRGLAEFKLRRAAGTAEIVRRRGWRFVKWGPLRSWAKRPDVALDLLEPVLGLSPEVEQTGQQLAFRW